MSSSTTRYLTLVLFITVIAYLPGLTGGFVFDDYANILQNKSVIQPDLTPEGIAQTAWSGGLAGLLKRPIPTLSFALNAALTGASPMAFKITNLAIHLFNGLLVFWFARLLLSANQRITGTSDNATHINVLAIAVAALWLLHPINLTSVLYVVQRMNSLAALFSLLALISYCSARERQLEGRKKATFLLYVAAPFFILCGLFSKENAVLVIPIIALIELLFYRFGGQAPRSRQVLIGVYSLLVAVGVTAVLIFLAKHADWLANYYEFRQFTLLERLYTEARVLWIYLSLILVPRLPAFALYHDDIVLSSSLLDPITTLFAIVALCFAVLAALIVVRRQPLISFVILWYLIGHALEGSVIPLGIAYEHRNYLPSVGLFIGIVAFGSKFSIASQNERLARLCVIAGVTILALLTFMRASTWGDPVTLATVEAENHPNSYRSVYAAARVQHEYYKMRGDEADYHRATSLLLAANELDDSAKAPLIALIHLAYGRGELPPPEWIDDLAYRFKNGYFTLTETRALGRFVECHMADPDCTIPLDNVVRFYIAALNNPQARPSVRAQLLVDFGLLNAVRLSDLPLAIQVLDEAVALKPNHFAYRMVRVRILLEAREFERLKQELQILRAKKYWDDRVKSQADVINAIEQRLNAALQRPESS